MLLRMAIRRINVAQSLLHSHDTPSILPKLILDSFIGFSENTRTWMHLEHLKLSLLLKTLIDDSLEVRLSRILAELSWVIF